MKNIILQCFVLIMLCACSVGPDFLRIPTPAGQSENFINAHYADEEAQNSMARWWARIDDPLLNGYVEQLLSDNLALKEAEERIIQARERVNLERGDFFPTLGSDGSASRSFTPGGSSNSLSTDRSYSTSYSADLSTSWQIDLFGKIRRSTESAKAQYEASIYDRDALIQSLIAELLNRRIAIAVNKSLLDFAKKTAENREQTYDIVKRRYDLGVADITLADVYLTEENLTSAKADIHEFERLLADEVYALDVLLGQVPGSTNPFEYDFPVLPAPLDVPLCLPADLLDRRPDLRASELRIKAATADIGVAVADLYPSLILGASLGFSGNETANLFSAEQLAGSILGTLTARLFEGGKLRANIRLQESEARELAAGYTDDVLNAMREVESALKAEQELLLELEKSQQGTEALRNAERITEERYRSGIESLRDLLDTQRSRYNLEQSLLRKQQDKWNTRIQLYLALGGDWFGDAPNNTDRCGKDI